MTGWLPVTGSGGCRCGKRQPEIVAGREGEDVEGRAVAGDRPENLDAAGRTREPEDVFGVDALRGRGEGFLRGGGRRVRRRGGEHPRGVHGGADARIRDTRDEDRTVRDV